MIPMSLILIHLLIAAPGPPTLGKDGLYDIVEVPPFEFPRTLLWTGLGTLTALVVIALGVRWFLRRTARTRPESPEAKALRRLREVEATFATAEPNSATLALSNILKDFLSERFRDPLRFETTPEFLRRISRESTKLPQAAQQDLSHFLTTADAVKFGNVPASATELHDLHHLASRIINLCQTIGDDSKRGVKEVGWLRE